MSSPGLRPCGRHRDHAVAASPPCGYHSHVEKATIAKLRNNLSAYLRKVRAGQPVIVYDRDVPIARLERIEVAAPDQDRLVALRARGVVRPALRTASAARLQKLLANPLPAKSQLLRAVQEERAEDR